MARIPQGRRKVDALASTSQKEMERLEDMQRLEAGIIQQREAALWLALSVRQVRRLSQAFRTRGAAGAGHP